MKRKFISIICMLLCVCCILPGCGKTSEEKAVQELQGYLKHPETFPFSFTYEGTKYSGFGSTFRETGREQVTEGNAVKTVLTFAHSVSGATFTVEARVYKDYGAYEWTVCIRNDGDTNTGVFSEINAADIVFHGKDPCVKGINGDLGDMYAPYETSLTSGASFTRESTSGRPTHGSFPYFNLEYGSGGTFVAVGWPGTWRADFTATSDKDTHFTCGQHTVSTYLAPGESIRTPLTAFLKYEGRDTNKNMNLWRRWFIDCNLRHVSEDGAEEKPFAPVFSASSMTQGTNENLLLRTVRAYQNHGVSLDYFWMDAGWYTNTDGASCSWPETGTWKVDTSRFPGLLRNISDEMAAVGGHTLLWFESEVIRLDKQKFLDSEPDFDASWILGTAMAGTWLEGQLVDLGNAALREWLLARICKVIDDGNISMYRQDFNVDPGPVWASCDAASGPNRTGYTENQYVSGYLAFWDALLARYPHMVIDSCASGGGRNDLETLRRAVPLHYSDFWDGNNGGFDERQATMQSLIAWLPYFKLEVSSSAGITPYHVRSCYAPWINLNMPIMKKDAPWDVAKQAREEWTTISAYFYADYYPLTEWSKSSEVWRGWEFFDADAQSGYMQLFRAENSGEDRQKICLYGLEKDRSYRLTDMDGTVDVTLKGSVLMEKGIEIVLTEAGSSTILLIRAV